MANSKIVLGNGEVLIDLTADTVKEDKILKGYTTHGADGEVMTGTCTYDSDTQDANAADAEILSGKTAYVKGTKKTGTMKNNGAVNGTISTRDGQYTVPQGFHDGSGKVGIAAAEREKLIPGNIRDGVTIMGITGTMSSSEGVKPQSKEVTPTFEEQLILPGAGYTHLSQVTVSAIRVTRTDNSAGGKTVTIG
jgi:hypothetical protein